MGFQIGPNGGISSGIDLPGVSGVLFTGRIYTIDERSLNASLLNDAGRGDGDFTPQLPGNSSGLLVLSGECRVDATAWLTPTTFNGVLTSVVMTINDTKKETISVRVVGHTFKRSQKNEDAGTLRIVCQILSMPTATGWTGTQPVPSAETHADKFLWGGLSISIDPQGLQTGMTQRLRMWAKTDTDAADVAAAQSALSAATAPISGLKLRPGPYTRVSSKVTYLDFVWGLTDTAEDEINPATITNVDPNKIQTGGTVAAINATPSIPSVTGQTTVERFTSTRELNDSNDLNTTTFGQRSTDDDVTMDGGNVEVDESGIGGQATVVETYDFGGSAPADAASPDPSLKAVAFSLKDLNLDRSSKTTYFKPNSSIEDWLYGRTKALSDPSNIKNLTLLGAVFVRGAEPNAPGAAGLVLKDKTLFDIVSPDTSDLAGVIWTYAETTSADDEVFPRSRLLVDANGLKGEAINGAIVTTAAVLSAPAAPSGLKFVDYTDSPLTNASASNQSLRLYHYGENDSADEWTQPKAIKVDDPTDLDDTEAVATLDSSSTHTPGSVSGLELIETRREKLTADGKFGWVDYFGRRNHQHAVEYDGSPQTVDASSLADAYSITHHESSATPSPAAATDGFVYRGSLILPRHKASTGEKWIHRDDYARVSRLKEIEFAGTKLSLGSTETGTTARYLFNMVSTVRIVTTTANPSSVEPDPGDYGPSGVAGKVVNTESTPLTTSQGAYTGYWQHTFIIAPNNAYDEIVNQGVFASDPADFGDEQTICDTATSPTFPATPTPSNTDLKLVFMSRRRRSAASDVWEFTWKFGRMTETDKRQLKKRTVDPDDFGETEEIPLVATSRTSSPGTPSQIGTSSNLIKTEVEDLVTAAGSFTGLYMWVFRFGPSTDKQLLEQEGEIDRDVSALTGRDVQTLTGTSSTPPSDPATRIAGMVIARRISNQVQNTPAKWKHRFVFAWVTEQQEKEYAGTAWEATPMLPKRQSVTTIVASTLAGDAYRDSIYVANKSDVLFDELIVRPEVPGKFRQTITTVANTKEIIPGGGDTFLDFLAAEPDPVSGGYGLNPVRIKITVFDPFFLVDHYIYNSVRVRPIPRYRTQTKFTLRRRFVTADPYSKLLHSQWGTVNTAAFLNFVAHEVRLNCATFRQDLSDAAAHLAVIDYDLASDSMFWFSYGNCNIGREPCLVQPVYPVTLYINPATYINAGWVAIWPAASDFSALTA
jgi:hypothetical protein